MKQFTLMLTVAEDALGETITAVTPLIVAQRVVLGTIAPVIEEPAPVRQRRDSSQDTPASQTRLGRLVLGFLERGPCTVAELSAHLAETRFSPNSASPILSKLISEDLVCRYDTSLNGVQTRVYALSSARPASGSQSSRAAA